MVVLADSFLSLKAGRYRPPMDESSASTSIANDDAIVLTASGRSKREIQSNGCYSC
jgi:hypothetical protein